MNFLHELQKQNEEYESPKSFWVWAGLSAISAVVKDNIYLEKFAYKMYPNIYVMLHADSGQRKGPPVSLARQLVKGVNNTHIIGGRSSIQGVLKEMGTAKSLPGGKIESMSTVFICSSELTSSLVEDKVATTILTDLYDRNYNQGEWRSLLKMESFTLKNPTVTMLTATNGAHSQEFFQQKDIKGGFIARTFIVYDNERQTTNSLMFEPKNKKDDKILIDFLKQISLLRGPINIDHDVRVYFDKWYRDFTKNIIDNNIKDTTGTINRMDDSILKVATLISLSNTAELNITKSSIEEAIEHCEKFVGNVRKTTLGSGSTPNGFGQHKVVLINELMDAKDNYVTRKALNAKYWMLANSKDWDEIAKSMEDSGYIRVEQHGGNIIYVMDKDVVEAFRRQFRGKD